MSACPVLGARLLLRLSVLQGHHPRCGAEVYMWLQLSRELEAVHQEHAAQLSSLTQQAEEQRTRFASERAQAQVRKAPACMVTQLSTSKYASYRQHRPMRKA